MLLESKGVYPPFMPKASKKKQTNQKKESTDKERSPLEVQWMRAENLSPTRIFDDAVFKLRKKKKW